MKLLVRWLINALALLGISYLMPSVSVSDFVTALMVALVLGLLLAAPDRLLADG